ncbi:protein MANNAN SYNTHESIS-RELATED 2-like [Apium graveolens]|uniref:protein MANNAN SYNTHESIS-RELATED 2-like n=1 Tax=Apium graveolens TaxID=4045 RepID=UPI003D79ED1C
MALLDIRQLMAGVLTFSMFVMLMNMVKTDYFDASLTESTVGDVYEQRFPIEHLIQSYWPSNRSTHALKPCWIRPPHRKLDQEKRDLGNLRGYIIFSLTGGHEHHLSQVSNAIVVAKRLGAILVIPDVIEERSGDRRKFGEIYDIHKFIRSIGGIVKISIVQPLEISTRPLTLVRVPNGVTEDYIHSKVEPLYKKKRSLKIVTDFSTSPVTKGESNNTTSVSCVAMFEALQLKAELQKTVHSMVKKLRSSGKNSSDLYIAVDLEDDILGNKECHGRTFDGRNRCYSVHDIIQFLKKIRIEREANIYLTWNGWHNSLNSLTEIYPNVHTKETLIPDEKVAPFLGPETSVYKKIIDYYICSWSDIYVPAKFDHFYSSVVGKRIAIGEKLVLEPAELNSENGIAYISPYIWRKSHYAYSCFC